MLSILGLLELVLAVTLSLVMIKKSFLCTEMQTLIRLEMEMIVAPLNPEVTQLCSQKSGPMPAPNSSAVLAVLIQDQFIAHVDASFDFGST